MSHTNGPDALEKRVQALERELDLLRASAREHQETRERWRAMVAAFDGLIYICSPDYRIEFINESFIRRTGHDPTGQLCYQALHDLEGICPWCINEKVFAGETVRWEVLSPKDNRWYDIVNTPIHHADGTISKMASIRDVTKRKENEKLLQELYQIVHNSPAVAFLWKNAEGWPVEYVSDNVARVFGYAAEDFTHGRIIYRDLIHAADRQRVEWEVSGCSGRKDCLELVHQPYRILTRGGEIRWVEDKTYIRRDDAGRVTHFQGIVEDISDRKQAEERIAASEKYLQDIIESVQDGISVLDRDLTIRLTNQVMRKWYAGNLPLEGKKCFQCYHNQNQPCSPCPSLRALQSGKTEFDTVRGLPESPVQWIELYSYPMRHPVSGQISGVVEFARDITEKRKLTEQLLQAQKMEAIGALAGGLAHDFNNLLMGIQGRSSLMRMDLDPGHPHHEHLAGIEEYVKSASGLTQQLLGIARGGKYEVKLANLNVIVERSANLFGRTKKEIKIVTRFEPALAVVACDHRQIEQVLLNLYVNAWQAMPSGGTLYLSTENVLIPEEQAGAQAVTPGKYVKLTVTDTGTGMDAATRARIFDPFFTTKAMKRGSGLGLASAYGIIRNHHGVIHVYSEIGIGTTFSIYLPATEKRIPEAPARPHALVQGSGVILLVDDEQLILDVGKPLLEKLGYRVLLAHSGSEAIEQLKVKKEAIDLVILDMVMPDMGGGETFERLKALDPDLKVLLSSGYSVNGQAQAILDRGCSGFIQKPFNLLELSEKLGEILHRPK